MIHHDGTPGYHWGVGHNYLGNIIVLAGSDLHEEQTRAILTIEQAEWMIVRLQQEIAKAKEMQDVFQIAPAIS